MRFAILMMVVGLLSTLGFPQGASAAPLGYNDNPLVISEDFNEYRRRHMVGNGWSELERQRNFVTVKSRKVSLRGTMRGRRGADSAIMSYGHDMSQFNSFELSFNWKALRQNERNDRIFVGYATESDASMKDASAWTTLFSGGAKGKKGKRGMSSFSGIFDFEEGVDLSNVKFMIWTDVSEGKKGKKEGFLFDNFVVTGLPGGYPFEPFFDDPSNPDQADFNPDQADLFDLSLTSFVSLEPVPVPASLPLLLAGLGALGYCAKRRRKAA